MQFGTFTGSLPLLQGPGVRVRSPSLARPLCNPTLAGPSSPPRTSSSPLLFANLIGQQTFPRPILAASPARLDPREAAQGPTCAHAGFQSHSLQPVLLSIALYSDLRSSAPALPLQPLLALPLPGKPPPPPFPEPTSAVHMVPHNQ